MAHLNRSPKNSTRRLALEHLCSRELLAADATLAWQELQSQPLIAETVDASFMFSNTGNATGFGPYVDLVVPGGISDSGTDSEVDAGASYLARSASALDRRLTETIVQFDQTGTAIHPFATDQSGNPILVKGNPNDQLVVFELPESVLDTCLAKYRHENSSPDASLSLKDSSGMP